MSATILLIPPPGDTSLLAPSPGGGTVPRMSLVPTGRPKPCPVCNAPLRWFRPPTNQRVVNGALPAEGEHVDLLELVLPLDGADPARIAVDFRRETALVLCLNGALDPIGMGRARGETARLAATREPVGGGPLFPGGMTEDEAMAFLAAVDHIAYEPGARVEVIRG